MANPSSMKSAILMAIQMAKLRRACALAPVTPNGRPAGGTSAEEASDFGQ
jgi:hypothetical protein